MVRPVLIEDERNRQIQRPGRPAAPSGGAGPGEPPEAGAGSPVPGAVPESAIGPAVAVGEPVARRRSRRAAHRAQPVADDRPRHQHLPRRPGRAGRGRPRTVDRRPPRRHRGRGGAAGRDPLDHRDPSPSGSRSGRFRSGRAHRGRSHRVRPRGSRSTRRTGPSARASCSRRPGSASGVAHHWPCVRPSVLAARGPVAPLLGRPRHAGLDRGHPASRRRHGAVPRQPGAPGRVDPPIAGPWRRGTAG